MIQVLTAHENVEATNAIHILVGSGVANLLLSFLLGWVLASKRTKDAIEKHHWLLVAHTVSLQEGLMLLGLAFALQYAQMSAVWLTAGAGLLAAGGRLLKPAGVPDWLPRPHTT